MAKVIKFAKGVRNHWKKSTLLAGCIAYGVSYYNEKYEIHQLMRTYCTEAARYGDQKVPFDRRLDRVLVILNPAANKKNSEEYFHEFCEPILHLAGYGVEIIKTDSEGHARRYLEEIQELPDAIIIAGGDGTVSEAITGLKRRSVLNENQPPVGILPVGRTNTLANNMFHSSDKESKLENVRSLANAAISVVRGKTSKKDLMKIEVLPNEIDEQVPDKPVFAVGSFQWGAFRDILTLRDKYWYTAGLKEYTAFLFNAFRSNHTWKCDAKLEYSEPCSGCSECFQKPVDNVMSHNNRWWSSFIPRFTLGKMATGPDYSKIINEKCSQTKDMQFDGSEIVLATSNIETSEDDHPKIRMKLGLPVDSGFKFLSDSWSRVWNRKILDSNGNVSVSVRSVELLPSKLKKDDEKDIYYSIDNEAYEVRPIRVTVVPNAIDMYTL